ncbi:MAG: hypothetical protein HGA75_12620 [Thiobacillus sp.]|nr:hypothetical protein [Thiobacillus sp.]
MRFIQDLFVTCATGYLTLEMIPMYGGIVSGLFDQVTAGLRLAQGM